MKRTGHTNAPEVYVCELHGEVARVPYGDFCEVCRKRAPYSEAREAAVRELVKVVRWVVSKDWQCAAVPAAYLQGLQRALDSVDALEEAEK